MNKSNLKTILSVVRDMIKRNRIAYKDYIGTETKEFVISRDTLNDNTEMRVVDSDFKSFITGEEYIVTVDEESQILVGRSNSDINFLSTLNDEEFSTWLNERSTTSENGFVIESYGLYLYINAWGDYIGKSITISQIRTIKKYNIKKLPEELLPSSVFKKINTAQTTADTAQTTADNLAHTMKINLEYGTKTNVESSAFSQDNSLGFIYSPAVEKVGFRSFEQCANLTSATFLAATEVGEYSFVSCKNLSSVNFPVLKTVMAGSFGYCKNLRLIDLPMATSIKSYAFYYSGLTTLILRNAESVCTVWEAVFTGTPIASGKGYIYVPDTLVDNYKSNSGWSTYASQIKPLSEYTGTTTT